MTKSLYLYIYSINMTDRNLWRWRGVGCINNLKIEN